MTCDKRTTVGLPLPASYDALCSRLAVQIRLPSIFLLLFIITPNNLIVTNRSAARFACENARKGKKLSFFLAFVRQHFGPERKTHPTQGSSRLKINCPIVRINSNDTFFTNFYQKCHLFWALFTPDWFLKEFN